MLFSVLSNNKVRTNTTFKSTAIYCDPDEMWQSYHETVGNVCSSVDVKTLESGIQTLC